MHTTEVQNKEITLLCKAVVQYWPVLLPELQLNINILI